MEKMLNKRKEIFAIHWVKNCAWHRHKYSTMGMAKCLEQIEKWTKVKISPRSGSRYMSQLVKERVFRRQPRRPRSVRGQLQTQTSLTFLKQGAFKLLGRFRPLIDVLNRLTDAPKMAYNLFKKRESHLRYVDNLSIDDSSKVKGAPSAVFRTA